MAVEEIARLFEPQSVAVFGASDDMGKYGGRIMHYLALHGYAGTLVPINARRPTVQGRTAYPSIVEAPRADVAVIALPAPAVPQALRECVQAGVGACVVITAGFAEMGDEGAALQREMLEIARGSRLRVVGPNCMGLMNLRNGMALTAARVFDAKPLHVAPIGLVSQSGAVMLSVFNRAQDQGIGFSQIVSVGNQMDLDSSDFLEFMVRDAGTQVICLHVEGVSDGPRLLALLREANAAGKPVVMLKTGRSEQGGEVAKSHTASLAGSYAVFEAACRSAGAVLVDDPDVMVLTAQMFLRWGAPRGRRLAVLSPSGGYNGIVVDRMADAGLQLATLGDATREALARHLPRSHTANPLDLGVLQSAAVLEDTRAVAELASADADTGLTLVPLTTSPDYERTTQALVDGLLATGKPALIAVTPGSVAHGARAVIRNAGVPYCDRVDDAMRVLSAWFGARAADAREAFTPLRELPPMAPGYHGEPGTKALLAAAGLKVPREAVVWEPDEAAAAARAFGFPVVLKGASDKVVHKTDAGLVKLGIADEQALRKELHAMQARLNGLGDDDGACIVAEMVGPGVEVIVGVRHDPVFGPAVLVGAGGVLVDLLQDVQIAPAPVSRATALEMVQRLKCSALLAGYRGDAPKDVDALVDCIVAVGRLARTLEGRLLELDINPLRVLDAGRGAVVLDARSTFA